MKVSFDGLGLFSSAKVLKCNESIMGNFVWILNNGLRPVRNFFENNKDYDAKNVEFTSANTNDNILSSFGVFSSY